MGAWIESRDLGVCQKAGAVVPVMRAWIGNTTTNGSLPVVNALPLSWKPKLENRLLPFKLPRQHFFYREHALNQYFRQNTGKDFTPTKQDYELLLRHSLSRFYTIYLFLAARVPCSPTSARMIQRNGPQQFRSIQILLVFPASAGMIPQAIGWMPCRFTNMRGDEWLWMRIS